MKIGFEVFLVVAREMSITKAANELHITQQCASDHIKRLEKEYNVVLFERRPKFRLTQAGSGQVPKGSVGMGETAAAEFAW